jgi:PAS domain S-box-containing protein
LATDLQWAPFEFVGKSGEPEGFSIEILKQLEQKLGIHFNLTIETSWPEILEKLQNRELDFTTSIVKTSDREQFLLFSEPFFTPIISVFTHKDNADIANLDDLKGQRVAIEEGFYLQKLLTNNYPEIKLIPVKNTLTALTQLSHGKVDAYIGNQGVANWLKEQHGLTNLHAVQNVFEFGGNPLRFGVRKDWPLLQGLVNKALASISNDDYLKTRHKWFGSDAKKTLVLSAKERRWLDKHQVIRFTGNLNGLPYEGIDKEGNYIGIVAEHLKLIEQRLGIETEFIHTQLWDESVAKVKKGEIDIFSESIDSELKSQFTFTQPYLSSPIVIVMKNNETYVENIEQIKNRKIALITSYGYAPEIISHYSSIEFEKVKNIQEGLTAVSTGKVDALFAPLAQASYQISELGMNNIRIVGKTEFTSQFAFAMSAEFKPLVPLFNRALNSISPREKQDITHLWGKQKFASRIEYVLLAQSTGILLIVILGIIYWNRKLAGQIRLRKKAEIALAKSQEQILRFSEEKFFKVFQSSPEIFIILRIADEKIIEVNNTFEQLCGWIYEEAVGKTTLELNFWSAEQGIAVIDEMKDKGLIRNKDTVFRTKTGDSRIGRISAERITISGEPCFIAIVDDVTDRRQTEAALRQSENKFSTAFQSSPYPLFISSLADGVILEVNNAFISLFEYTQVELIGYSDLDLSFWTDLQVRNVMVKQLNNLKQVKEMETELQTKSGGLLYCVFSAEVINLNGKECIINIIQDFTQRKQAEDEVLDSRERLRNLANRLEEIREDERIGIARELHDELGQALTGFKIDLIRLSENIPKLKTNQDIVNTMVNNIDSTIDVIRKISSELRPPILDDLGLESAIEWATRRFSEQTGIKNSINIDCDDMVIDGARDTAVFRIYQEALVNIARHSNAKNIEVNVQIVDSVLEFVLKDDGVGITEVQIQDNKSIGLIGMQERAAHIGASIYIKNAKSGGTEVSLSVPLVLEKND